MQALRYLILSFLMLTTSFSSLIRSMEQRDLYPWPTLTYMHTEPTTFNVNPASIIISCGATIHRYPLNRGSEELSSIQKIHNQLLEKDCAEYKEESAFTLPKSRYTQFVKQRDQIIDTCIECLSNSTTAKLELVNLAFLIDSEEKLTEELNVSFHRYLQSILQEFYTYEGELKFCTPTDYENAARRIGNMFVEFFPWNECLPRIQECKKNNIPGFEKFYYDVTSTWVSFKGAYQAILDSFKYLFKNRHTLSEFKNLITNNSFNNDLCKLKKAYEVSNNVIVNRTTRKYYDQNKEKQEKGITEQVSHRSHLIRSYGEELSKSTFPIKRLKSIQEKHPESPLIQHVSLMAQKHVTRNARIGSQVGTVVYLITALHRIPQKRLEKNKRLYDKEFADAYSTLFDNRGLPSIFQYNEEALKSLIIPPSIGNYGKVKERLLLYKLASLRVKPEFINQETFKISLQNALQYLCHGLKDADHAQTYYLLIEALYDTLTNPLDSSLRSIITTCDFLPSKEHEQAVYSIVLDHVRTLLHALDESLSCDQEKFLHNALTALSRVWVQARNGSEKAQEILTQPSPMSALLQQDFLKTPPNYEKAHNTSKHLQQRMDELGFNKIITANAYAISAPALQKIEERCIRMGKYNEIPDFTTIMEIMHDAHTPRPITTLLQDALEIWNVERQPRHIREIAVTATHCAEVAYGYHKISSREYYEIYLGIGNDLCKYARIVGKVVVKKVTTGVNLLQGLAEATTHCISWSIKSAAKTTELLLDCEERFVNSITGRGRICRNDYLRQQMLSENLPNPDPSQGIKEAKATIQAIGNVLRKSQQSIAFICYLAGIPFREYERENFETQQALLGYLEKYNDLPAEEKFEHIIDFTLDWVIYDKIFCIASQLFKLLLSHTKEVAQLRKVATVAQEVEECEYVAERLYNAELALAGATEEKLIPDILFSKGVPSKAVMSKTDAPKRIFNKFSHDVVDFELKYGEKVVDEVMQLLKWGLPGTFNKVYNFRKHFKVPKTMSQFFESLMKKIVKIDRKGFKPYRLEKGACELKNIYEAEAAIACQKQGLLGNLIRDSTGIGDFIETAVNQTWDVKAAISHAVSGQPIFQETWQIEGFIKSLRNELAKPTNENLILSIGQLEKASHEVLYTELKQFSTAELQRIIVVDEFNPLNSKTTQELLKFLGHK